MSEISKQKPSAKKPRAKSGIKTVKPAVKKSKANALRAKKRAAARKMRKNKMLTLLSRYDRAVKEGRPKATQKLLGQFKLLKMGNTDIEKMRNLSSALQKAESAVARQQQAVDSPAPGKSRKSAPDVAQKKLNDAIAQLKKAQIAEQEFFLEYTRAQAKNASCPFCSIDRISVDSHVMDVHSSRWGEYLHWLGNIK